jgi:hypothetical protein
MQYLGKTKVGKARPKPDTIYPTVRLPRKFINIIGETVHFYETQREGQEALLIVLGKNKTRPMVIQPSCTTDVKKSLSTVESQITELKSLILENTSCLQNLTKKEAPESGFEPESEPRQGSMIGRYTTRACISAVTA